MEAAEGIVESFRVTCWDRRLGHQIGREVFRQETISGGDRTAPIDTVGLVRQADGDFFRFFLFPDQGALGAGDGDAEVILVADANLGGADERFAAVAQLAVDGEVVVEHAAFDEGFHLRREVGDIKAGDIAELHQRVGADIAAAAGTAGALGIDPPSRLLLAGGF